MKRKNLSYNDWTCITSKELIIKNVVTDSFEGHISIIKIEEVTEPQIWRFNGEEIVTCDKGLKCLAILPKNDFYCITALMNAKEEILLWYIDMIANQGVDSDGVPYFDDLYLDLVVYPDGTIIEDDRNELEEALTVKDISEEQYKLAIDTSIRLREGLLKDIEAFKTYTYECLNIVR